MKEPRILELNGLSKTITLHILDSSEVEPFTNVTFHVDEGEFVAIVGASGSGKSSIIKAIHRTYLPTRGQALYRTADGDVVDLANAPDRRLIQLRRREIGFVSQFLKVEPRVPALDVVAGPLLRRNVERGEARHQASVLLERLDIPQKLWVSYPTLFSGGEQQRLNIARALIARPRLLLADEPTSALDTLNTGRVIELLTEARQQGMTIVGVFHDLELIERLADRVIVMENGRVLDQGKVGQVVIPRFDLKQELPPVSDFNNGFPGLNPGATPQLAITNAIVVLPHSVLENGSVGIINGRIVEVVPGNEPLVGRYDAWIDARGAYLMPGIIDLHNDGLEVEVNPRPETNLPVEMALSTMERRLMAAGVTTEFHAIAFMDNARNKRTVSAAAQRALYVSEYIRSESQLINNQILHRLDVWSPDSLDLLFESIERMPVKYLSINDHTPGQGQYRDLTAFRERMTAWSERRGGSGWTDEEISRRVSERASDEETVPYVYSRIQSAAGRMPLQIASHDDDSPEKVAALASLGASVTEFPVTVEAAQKARDLGMTIVVGAPNIVRGGSSSGNQDASELFSLGLADSICADYHAPSLLPSAFRLVDEGLLDLASAVRALGYNAAKGLGLNDLGAIEPGYLADLIVVRREGRGVPQVERVLRCGRGILSVRTVAPVGVPV